MNKEALHYRKLENGVLECLLCPHDCRIGEGKSGICGVRSNQASMLVAKNYNKISSMGLDPIEKKPLYHYKPGSHILSVGSVGCNFSCGFCQNHAISMGAPETVGMTPEKLVEKALELRVEGNIGIAFTYNEPTVWYEYVRDSSRMAKEAGLDVVLVSNGYINEKPFSELAPFVDAVNIDLKAFTDEFYRKVCHGGLESVKRTIEQADSFCHVEITTLLIDGYNASAAEIDMLSQWVAGVNADIPLHLSRYHPAYQFSVPATTMESMKNCYEAAARNLHHVYMGNVWNMRDGNDTYCYRCGKKLIARHGYDIEIHMKTDNCPECGTKVNIIL